MNPARAGALLGVAAATLLLAAPAALAAPTSPPDAGTVDVVLGVDNGALDLEAGSGPIAVSAARERVELRWDTTAIDRGTVFGDTVTLRTSVVDSTDVEVPTGEPVTVPVSSNGTLRVDAPTSAEHTLRLEASAHTLDGSPLAAAHDYPVILAQAERPEIAVRPTSLPQTPARVASPQPPQARAAAPEPRVAALAAQPPTATGRVTLDQGHVDAIAPRLFPEGLSIQVKDGTVAGTTTWREPSDVEFRVTAAARTALPAQPELAFLGGAGKQVFLLPQTQQPTLLWTGWNTEELRPADVSGPVTWTLAAVDGPGAFGLFTTGSFGAPSVIFNSTDGLPDAHGVALGTHAHANWVFAEPGRYRLSFTVSGSRPDGTALTDAETYTFVVGDAAESPAQQQNDNTDRQTGTPTGLASTGPADAPAAAGVALGLIISGSALLVITRRRPAEENL